MVILTVVSVGAAIGAAAFAWRLARDERRRSDARVAALAFAIDGGPLSETVDSRDVGNRALDAFAAEANALSAHVAVVSPAENSVATSRLFETTRHSSEHGHPLLKVAVVFAMAVALIVAIASMNDGRDAATTPIVASTRTDASLELLSMRHVVEGDTLIVTGVVRNVAPTAASHTTPVVFVFDRSGKFVASGGGALAVTSLAPGTASPFRVALPQITDVGRYRVTFRNDAGVVRHMDRRAEHMAAAQ